MSKLDILEIHEQYSNIYEGYKLIGSYSLFIPFYKFEITYEYLKETKLSIIEQYICRCIQMGINDFEEISFVLAIDEDILEFYINELIMLNYIVQTDSKLELTEEAKILYNQLLKRVPERQNCNVYFNTLKGSYSDDITEGEVNHEYVSYDKAIKDVNSIILEPRIIGGSNEEHSKNIKQNFLANACDVRGINNINLLDGKELVYHNIYLLLFKSKDKYKILCYDNCGYFGVDNSITEVIQGLYENKELFEILKENTALDGVLFEDILNNYEKELELLENDEKEEIIREIKEAVEDVDSLKYIMNYEIRKRFLDYLENSKESLYIISPWMNNYIVNDEFISKLESLLKRNVKIRIIYGISHKDETNEDFRNKNTVTIANKLSNMAKPYGDLFKIEHGQTHEKLVISDRKYYINGSFNFLSYSGESDGKFRNEGSTYSENERLINQTIKLRFNE